MTTTPFRYPGAKNKLLPVLMEYIDKTLEGQDHFVDLFVGGGSVLLEVAQKYPKIQLYANDKNSWISSFWKIVAGGDADKFEELQKLVAVKPTLERFYKLREEPAKTDVEEAYRGLFFNRTTFSGISYSGPIGGKEQKSKYTVDCRYNSKKLKAKLILCRELLQGRTTVSNNDFHDCEVFIDGNYPVYLDPPYYVKGDALYTEKMTNEDHEDLSGFLKDSDNWVLSYDDCSEIRELYKDNTIIDLSARYCINGKKNNWESKNELIIVS